MTATEQVSLVKQRSILLEQISTGERAVHDRGELLKRIVEEKCREVLRQLETVKERRIKAIQAKKEN